MNDMTASRQWRERPPHERYWTLAEMHAAAEMRRASSVESKVAAHSLTWNTQADSHELVLQGAHFQASPSHFVFDQICRLVDAPAPFLRRAPATLVADMLNWACRDAPRPQMTMLWQNPSPETPGLVRAFTTDTYSRLWDDDIIATLINLTQDETNGWTRPPACTDDKYPSGYYLSDRDLFAFMVNPARPVAGGPGNQLNRGFYCWNTEVQGGRFQSFGFKAFLYDYVCGNHIIWGAEELFTLRMAHVGHNMIARAEREMLRVLRGYLDAPAAEEQLVQAAMHKELGRTKAEVLAAVRQADITLADATEAYNLAEQRGENPLTVWALVCSLTRMSQRKAWADERDAADRRAGRLLREVAF